METQALTPDTYFWQLAKEPEFIKSAMFLLNELTNHLEKDIMPDVTVELLFYGFVKSTDFAEMQIKPIFVDNVHNLKSALYALQNFFSEWKLSAWYAQ